MNIIIKQICLEKECKAHHIKNCISCVIEFLSSFHELINQSRFDQIKTFDAIREVEKRLLNRLFIIE